MIMPPLFRDSTSCNLLSSDNSSTKSQSHNTTSEQFSHSNANSNSNTTVSQRVKCVLIGDGAVGKTSLIVSYTTNGYPTEYVPTAFDNYSVVVTVDNQPLRLQLCDTAGQDDFDTLRTLCYPQTSVFLLCFSVVCPTSFHNICEKWLPEIKRHGNKAPIVLIGTQCDLRHDVKVLIELAQFHEQPVSSEAANRMANKIGAFKYIECSALTQKNLKEVFDTAILAGLEHHKHLMRKANSKSSILVSWGRSKGKKLLKNSTCNFNDPYESSSSSSSTSSTSNTSTSTTTTDCGLTPPKPYPRKESYSPQLQQQLFHHRHNHSKKIIINNNLNDKNYKKGWLTRFMCCGL